MKVFRRAADLQNYLRDLRTNNRSVGFVPTMGALHQGHLSLVELSRAANQVTVVSIFVNPTQFNDARDLEKYPRTPGKDLELLDTVGCEVAFLPTVEEVYPPRPEGDPAPEPLDFGPLERVMEGAMRPGHFGGVAQVVHRLLELTLPDRLYLGQKDYQQVAIIRQMIHLRQLPVTVVVGPTQREDDGLARSSRNVRLSPATRRAAPELHRVLLAARDEIRSGTPPADATAAATTQLEKITGFRVEYVEAFDGRSLQPINDSRHPDLMLALAVWAEDVRLIDNLRVRG